MKPCESPIEDIFLCTIRKHINPELRIDPQVWARTRFGNFRMDFVIKPWKQSPDPGVAFECDGSEHHAPHDERDELRDAMILDSGAVRRIWRIRGFQIWHCLDDCLYVLSRVHPRMFSDRGLTNLNILASPETKQALDVMVQAAPAQAPSTAADVDATSSDEPPATLPFRKPQARGDVP